MSEEDNFVEEMPEDYFAYEELQYPDRKCRKPGSKKRDKFRTDKRPWEDVGQSEG